MIELLENIMEMFEVSVVLEDRKIRGDSRFRKSEDFWQITGKSDRSIGGKIKGPKLKLSRELFTNSS